MDKQERNRQLNKRYEATRKRCNKRLNDWRRVCKTNPVPWKEFKGTWTEEACLRRKIEAERAHAFYVGRDAYIQHLERQLAELIRCPGDSTT